MPDTLIEVYIRSRRKLVFGGAVHSVSSFNVYGSFDILPFHANFITLIKDALILDKTLPTEQHIEINHGLLSAHRNKVDIYLDV